MDAQDEFEWRNVKDGPAHILGRRLGSRRPVLARVRRPWARPRRPRESSKGVAATNGLVCKSLGISSGDGSAAAIVPGSILGPDMVNEGTERA